MKPILKMILTTSKINHKINTTNKKVINKLTWIANKI